MEEKIKELRTIVHRLSNDFSGVKATVDLAAMGLKKELDLNKIKAGMDKINESLTQLKKALRFD
jgi:hypothetical protein